MIDYRSDNEADIDTVVDRGENVALMEPLQIGEGSRHRGDLSDLVVDLVGRAAGFRRGLPRGVEPALAGLIRSVNCYYSNLIEGHYTHPVEIEHALEGEYSPDSRRRDFQLEAKSHIAVQH
ncbi:hypothetical protein [Thioalkalivibrio sp. ALMg13-2]|uniref:hypothetical protein n=1 Tax=Thioalkalivibrio sp. ALMg13-2 TaxID=1158167 RepID=UPI0012DF95C7|nr:hypothetical protein [Thioalkalivibrio sp. ALMg13-2]